MGKASVVALSLDRSSDVPLYSQVSRQIEAAMERGELRPGARLETEVDLARRCGLSRPTVRRALQELVDKGLLVRKRGRGTQVVGGPIKRQVRLTSLYDDLLCSGRQPTTEVLTHEIVAADEDVAARLGLAVGANVVHLERLRAADGEPLAVLRNWLPVDVAASITAEQLRAGGLYERFRAAGITLRIASQRIGARGADPAESRLLGLRPGAAVLTMERTSYDDSGRPVELGRHSYTAERYSFEVMVVER